MAEKIEKLFSSHEYNYFASVHVCKSIAYERIILYLTNVKTGDDLRKHNNISNTNTYIVPTMVTNYLYLRTYQLNQNQIIVKRIRE